MGKSLKRTAKKIARAIAPVLLMDEFAIAKPNADVITADTVAAKIHNPFVGRFSGMRVTDYQNHVFECNVVDMQTNDELAANFTREFPMSSTVRRHGGKFPSGSYMDGVRNSYNTGKHGCEKPSTPSPKIIINGDGQRVVDPTWAKRWTPEPDGD